MERERIMSKKKKKNIAKKAAEQPRKKTESWLLPTAAVVLCAAVAVIFIVKANTKNDIVSENSDNISTVSDSEVQVIEEGGSLIIPTEEVTETASFYPIEVDGTRMEVLAVRDSDGNIRTAFNTCQICYGSGRGYYVQNGSYLVCQNCGNRFTVDQVEIEYGGCNPYPIFSESKTETDSEIEIPYDFLEESKNIFANWRAF